ncbi:UNVERIFIED_CONTAM: Plant intracellular Ras-group-related LRR protein 8 [Sesamum latifolium]|uniref:Plant intracellular Ras-group-related LRR protein 8 n=1 Tax=Sesamum latifolium TaxID=2727402 RepID=A0AAW2XYD9_9LAMI
MDQQDAKQDASILKLNIKFSGRSIPVEIGAESTVKDLKSLLQPLTNVLPRGQKLIFKGDVWVLICWLSFTILRESSVRRTQIGVLGISDGAKIMLMASQGLHQGDGPVKNEAVMLPSVRRVNDITRGKKEKSEGSVTKSQLERWKATGVIALSDCGLTTIPEEVWTCGPSARVLDVSQNSLLEVPAAVGCLSSMQKLLLNGNHLLDKSIGWEGLTSLKLLTVLSLNQNNLTTLPSAIGAFTCLKQLHIANNKLTCIPTEIGCLTELQVLKAQNNRLKTVPASIEGCFSLVEEKETKGISGLEMGWAAKGEAGKGM